MSRTIKAKYKKGARVFEPLEHVDLADDDVVDITVPDHATSEDDAEFLASAGGWRDLYAESFIRETYEHRRHGTRPTIEL